jgi:hypothetical protein
MSGKYFKSLNGVFWNINLQNYGNLKVTAILDSLEVTFFVVCFEVRTGCFDVRDHKKTIIRSIKIFYGFNHNM